MYIWKLNFGLDILISHANIFGPQTRGFLGEYRVKQELLQIIKSKTFYFYYVVKVIFLYQMVYIL